MSNQNSAAKFLFMSMLCILATQSVAAEIPLYSTGPSVDAAFVRFANASTQRIDMLSSTSKTKVKLDTTQPFTAFYPVRANSDIQGEFQLGQEQTKISVNIKPGEFVTVVARSIDNKLSQITLRESPEDFNALKSSIALYNADPTCLRADLRVAGRSLLLFENVAFDTLKRRSVNPIQLSVELLCEGNLQGKVLNIGQLEAGGRYTILVGSSAKESRLLYISDDIAK